MCLFDISMYMVYKLLIWIAKSASVSMRIFSLNGYVEMKTSLKHIYLS
jgi:hypothetical protein